MGTMVENAVRKSVSALLERKEDLAKGVIEEDDKTNKWENRVENECLKILALHQPVAEDLRFVAAVMKINNDLERMGDLAVNIAERALYLSQKPPLPMPDILRDMTEATAKMVRGCLDAFVNRNSRAARKICEDDDIVDDYNYKIIADILKLMKQDPENIERGMQMFSSSRHLERIADHATNIAEDVVYMVEGEIIRHLF